MKICLSRGLLLSSLFLPRLLTAQSSFVYTETNGTVLAGFRNGGAKEFVANIGKIEDFQSLAPGASINITTYTSAQLAEAFADFNSLNWSVFATFDNPSGTALGANPYGTSWWTVPRTNLNVQTARPARLSVISMAGIRQQVLGIGQNGVIACTHVGQSCSDFGPAFVAEYSSDPYSLNYSVFMADTTFPDKGTFRGKLSYSVEDVTPASFTSPVRSDLYRMVPNTIVDPDTGNKTSAYFVGYFELGPNGTLSFTRAGGSVTPPPAAPQLTIARSGNMSTISFASSNSVTYSLYYTNLAGLTSPVTNWSLLPGTLSGNNSTLNFTDTTPDADRIYRVKAAQ